MSNCVGQATCSLIIVVERLPLETSTKIIGQLWCVIWLSFSRLIASESARTKSWNLDLAFNKMFFISPNSLPSQRSQSSLKRWLLMIASWTPGVITMDSEKQKLLQVPWSTGWHRSDIPYKVPSAVDVGNRLDIVQMCMDQLHLFSSRNRCTMLK